MTDEWDAVNGERHIRRPGLDKMLMYLSSMYDIYIITNMDANYGMTLMPDIDKNHVCSGYLYSDSMKLRKGTRVKDISYFSRLEGERDGGEAVQEREEGEGHDAAGPDSRAGG